MSTSSLSRVYHVHDFATNTWLMTAPLLMIEAHYCAHRAASERAIANGDGPTVWYGNGRHAPILLVPAPADFAPPAGPVATRLGSDLPRS